MSTLDALAHLPKDILLAWSKCETLVRIESEVERDGKVTHEERFYISSLQAAQAETIRVSVRAHWLIENQLHWTLDTAFREDGNRVRKGNGPECGAVLRHIALNLLRQDPNSTVRSINARRHRAGRLPQIPPGRTSRLSEGCQTGVPPKRKKGLRGDQARQRDDPPLAPVVGPVLGRASLPNDRWAWVIVP